MGASVSRCAVADEGFDPKAAHGLRSFEPGNAAAVRHGAYAPVLLQPRVAELEVEIAAVVPNYRRSDAHIVKLLAICEASIERAVAGLETVAPGDMARLEADLRSWINSARRLANDLALSPTARARLKLDVALERRASDVTTLPATDAEAAELDEGVAS
jgi:hypothetical protein